MPLVPIVLATGWSALILFAVRVPLNPMSVTLGALVIAISTEFSVLLSERHRQERLAGHDASRRCVAATGVRAPRSPPRASTAIAGFGVLALSDIRMLRDFGLVTLIDLSVSLLGVLVALPAALVLAERASGRAHGRAPLPSCGTCAATGAGSRAAGRAAGPGRPEAPGRDGPDAGRVGVTHGRRSSAAALRYGRYVGLLGLLILVLITINTVAHQAQRRHRHPARSGSCRRSPCRSHSGNLPAKPTSRRHADQGSAGKVPACSVRGPQVLNMCQLYEQGPVVLALFVDAGSCPDVLERDAVASRLPFRGCASRRWRSRATVLRCAGWCRQASLTFPVGLDPDGALAAL